MQVVLVHLQPFRHTSRLKGVSQPEIAKNSLQALILGVQSRLRSSMLIALKSLSPVLVMVSSMSVVSATGFRLDEPIAVK